MDISHRFNSENAVFWSYFQQNKFLAKSVSLICLFLYTGAYVKVRAKFMRGISRKIEISVSANQMFGKVWLERDLNTLNVFDNAKFKLFEKIFNQEKHKNQAKIQIIPP